MAVRIINTAGAIVFGMVYDFLPFMVLPIYNVLIKIGQDKVDACACSAVIICATLLSVKAPVRSVSP